ncbi:hypothetical protein HYU13_03125 [Candidatus Woesearchaeota archaeon]|nr:hypothetical protein [Candidatus Woesearchaeota archaeon]
MKKLIVGLMIVLVVFSAGCKTIRELYGLEPVQEPETVSLEDIVVEQPEDDLPPPIPEEGMEGIPEEEKGEVIEAQPEEEAKVPSAAKVLIVKETDLVSLQPKISDPDADVVKVSYTSPLDEKGQWQTAYGDAGEYTITVTATDSQLTTTQDVLVIVNKKEESPTIDSFSPSSENVEAKEDSELDFSIEASDLNKDELSFAWSLDGDEVAVDTSAFTYKIDFDAAGSHELEATVADESAEVSRVWKLDVANVNRKPLLEELQDISVKETEEITIAPEASDPDGDEIEFSIGNEKFQKSDDGFSWLTTYDDAGTYEVSITASDGTDDIAQKITVTVENVNRPPVIEDIVLG